MGFTRFIAKKIVNYENPGSIGSRIRRGRIQPFLDLIEACYARQGRVRILDIGGTEKYWKIFPQEMFAAKGLDITLVNVAGTRSRPPQDSRHFRFVEGDGCDLSQYADESFDIVHSNSVIEHVGDWRHMKSFAREVRRLAPSHFVQTPYFWFPVEPHNMTPFFHWLPKPVRIGMVMRLNLGHWKRCATVDDAISRVESARLLDRRMFRHLFPDAVHLTERFFGFPKSLIAVRTGDATPSSIL